ncbi:transaldolase [Nocardioides marmoriginsengisoli]|uniref:Transaldolase n=1 Tax=Nocardioides marmoriginsengisoli TaxID=661483 RepID=A0A3N0CAE0_9ACTN|nr:transaldolase [Nocardioides marmoriginsengisoli]RNL59933.1 transaldolase [Nocardioides marmoriginsengisoli]
MSDRLKQLSDAGVSIWLDDLSRERLETGNLAELVKSSSVVGVTTNPSIFAAALADGERYDDQVRQLAADGADVNRTVFELTTTDVRNACDVLHDVWAATGGVDGRVSIEVSPDLADDTAGTIAEARKLWDAVGRENLLIKIPGTAAGCPAITATLAAGISVNVTLIFGLDQYADVMEAHVAGLEQAAANGHDLATIHSVASFFVSRVDTEIDSRLEKTGADAALQGRAGVANARLAFEAFETFYATDRWAALEASGARRQRPLWASTGVKNPQYDDTMYVVDLVVEDTVNTMPEKTMQAVADHGVVAGDRVRPFYDDARATLQQLAAAGIDYDDVIDVLTREGVEKFVTAWQDLLGTVQASLEAAAR